MVIDPICCLTVDESTERRSVFDGKSVYFCSERCREKFISTPDAVKHKLTHQEIGAHTCAKHPELWQEDPSDCPNCRAGLDSAKMPTDTNGARESKLHSIAERFLIAASVIFAELRRWGADTTKHLPGFISATGRGISKSRKRLVTSSTEAR